jgi:hypothetical protein
MATTLTRSKWTQQQLYFFPETVTGIDALTYYFMKWSYESSFSKWTCMYCQKPFDYIVSEGEDEEEDVHIYAYMWEADWCIHSGKTPFQLCLTCIWEIIPHPTDQFIDEKEWVDAKNPITAKKLTKYASWISDIVNDPDPDPLHAITQLKSFLFKKQVALTTVQAKDLLLHVIAPQLVYKEWFAAYCQLVYAFVWNKWDINASHPVVGTYYRMIPTHFYEKKLNYNP